MRALAVFGLFFLTACEPNITGTTTKVFAVVLNKNNKLEQREVELQYLTSAVHMTGPNMTFVGGAQLLVDQSDPSFATNDEAQLEDVIAKNHGGSVRASYLEKGGALVPTDFQTWGMTTTWYNFEKAFDYFKKVYDGKPTDELKKARAFYWVAYRDLGVDPDKDLADNAAWQPLVKSFLVAPFKDITKLPLSMNLGVIGHEFAHMVFNKRAFAGKAKPAPYFSQQWTGAPFNLLTALDEGVADWHGFGVTCSDDKGPGCDPRFLALSFDSMNVNDAKLIAARDLSDDSKAKCMTAELRNAMNTFQGSAFQNAGLQYKVGTLIAVSMYWASVPTGKADVMQKSLINSYDDESAGTPGFKQFLSLNIEKPAEFTPEVLTNIIASHIEDLSLRNQFCKQMWDRLDLDSTKFPSADLPACLAAARGTTCPILKQ